jgi:hypothetical protein
MMLLLLTVLLGAAPAQRLPAPDDPSRGLSMFGVVYYPDGKRIWTVHPAPRGGQRQFTGSILVTETLCIFNAPPSRESGYGWRYEIEPVSSAGDTVVVDVRWHRAYDRGLAVSAPSGSVRLTLKPGDRIPLDYVVPGPPPEGKTCTAIGMGLEVRLGPLEGDGADVVDAEMWLVRHDPAGTEATLASQKIRASAGQETPFWFEDQPIGGEALGTAIRVSGKVVPRRLTTEGDQTAVTWTLELTRAIYVGTNPISMGQTTYTFHSRVGQVDALRIPPQAGSRAEFSLRVRLTVVR